MNAQVLTVSSKGQISLPVNIRKLLSIETGDKLVAYASGDAIMLKALKLPTIEEFEDALNEAINEDMVVINLLDILGENAKEEEIVEGMEAESEEDTEEGIEYDEHVWLSLKNTKLLCKVIADELSKLDASNSELYSNNVKLYIEQLDMLDKEYEESVEKAAYKTLVFGDRFPFRYMTDDYNIDYYAAFAGCSSESEASFETITFLADKVDELGIKSIMQIETSDGKIAGTIKDATKDKNQNILTLDSMQSVSARDIEAGVNYIDIMKSNLDVLNEAIN